jgi:hypothetical protein
MKQSYNLYCDESCHLENDKEPVMVLGAIWCPKSQSKEISQDLHAIKRAYGLDQKFEVKWKKVGSKKVDLYKEFVNYFFNNNNLHFRCWIAEKQGLNHHQYPGQNHDVWYYKMYFGMLKVIFSPYDEYFIYLDIKDHWGGMKVRKLHDVICNSMYDFNRNIVKHIQIMHSYETELLQLADLLIGAVSYVNRNQMGNRGKEELIGIIKKRSNYNLATKTLFKEDKFNIFRWRPRDENGV